MNPGGSPMAGNHRAGTGTNYEALNNSSITFTAGEISDYFAARIPNLKQRGAEWRGPCLIHKGRDNNFAVDAQTGRWFCHSACGRGGDLLEFEQTLTGIGFAAAKAEVFRMIGRAEPGTNGNSPHTAPSKPTKPTGAASGLREVERYRYTDETGNLRFEVIRYLRPDGGKAFRQCRPDGRGGAVWNLDGIERVPYHLPNLLNAETVYLPEGEKDVHTLEAWGLMASCNPGGSGSSQLYADVGPLLSKDRHVVILPDNDATGPEARGGGCGGSVGRGGFASASWSFRACQRKGDVTDWRASRRHVRAVPGTDRRGGADGCGGARRTVGSRWGLADEEPNHPAARVEVQASGRNLEPIQSELPPVQPFAEDLLPVSFRPLVRDVSHRMQVPMDFPGVLMVLCLAGAVNRRAVIQPKENDSSWIVTPNLWGGDRRCAGTA